MMKFEKIWLFSQSERRALSMAFGPGVTMVTAGNGFGKSALLKSLYDTFGAEPHRIDKAWKDAGVGSLVEFTVDKTPYAIMKFAGTFSIFDELGRRIFQATSVGQLAPYLADLLDFRLLMTDVREKVTVPPPAYIFAPFYVDQDKSWSTAWEPFRSMYLPRSAQTLADYHSGLKPNEYYVAQAERDRLGLELKDANTRKHGLMDAVEHLRAIEPETALTYDLDAFEAETSALLEESTRLNEKQSLYRIKLSELQEERSLWEAQRLITKSALAEMEEVFESAVGHSIAVDCPTCGAHYVNDISAKFGISADLEALIAAMRHSEGAVERLDREVLGVRSQTDEVETALARIHAILNAQKGVLTFGEVVATEGRNSATKQLKKSIGEIDSQIGGLSGLIEEQRVVMNKSLDRRRSKQIKDHFTSQIVAASTTLDVRMTSSRTASLSTVPFARGSEGPRGMAAYYYAILDTARAFGSSVFCPLVIDAPNQQGQDAEHLPALISFLVTKRPNGAQLILGVEEPEGIADGDADIMTVGVRKNQLLREDEFASVQSHLRPFFAQLV